MNLVSGLDYSRFIYNCYHYGNWSDRMNEQIDYLGVLSAIAVVQFFGAASPGPNFVIVTNYATSGSRRLAFLASCGILLATLTWAMLGATGIGVVLLRMPAVYEAVQFAGAAYLIWIGAKMIVSAIRNKSQINGGTLTQGHSARQAVQAGYTTSMTNPKSLAYYSSIFIVMIPPNAPWWLLAAAVCTAVFVSGTWWFSVAIFFTTSAVRNVYVRARRSINMFMGGILMCLGLRLASGR